MSELQEIFFDLETKRWSDEVEGGWNNIPAFGLSVAVTCWNNDNSFQTWLEADASKLVNELQHAGRIIGFNLMGFDYEVLHAYAPVLYMLLDRKTLDILADIRSRLGFRVSLDSICSATLGKSKSGSGYDAIVDRFNAATNSEEAAKCMVEADKYALEKHWSVVAVMYYDFTFWQPYIKGCSGEALDKCFWARVWIEGK